jgi:hypothetical protein
MRRKHKVYFFLAIIFSFIMLVMPVYIHYSNLSEADVSSRDLCFENPDQDNLWAGDKDESRVFGLNAPCDTLPLARDLLKMVYVSFSQTPSFDQNAIILRC